MTTLAIELEEPTKEALAACAASQHIRDHALTGNYIGHRECHILPDWLLIYKIESDILTLTLTRTGSHSDLF